MRAQLVLVVGAERTALQLVEAVAHEVEHAFTTFSSTQLSFGRARIVQAHEGAVRIPRVLDGCDGCARSTIGNVAEPFVAAGTTDEQVQRRASVRIHLVSDD